MSIIQKFVSKFMFRFFFVFYYWKKIFMHFKSIGNFSPYITNESNFLRLPRLHKKSGNSKKKEVTKV